MQRVTSKMVFSSSGSTRHGNPDAPFFSEPDFLHRDTVFEILPMPILTNKMDAAILASESSCQENPDALQIQ
jgi:hypothetical protein